MSDHTSEPGRTGNEPGSEPDVLDEDREAAMMRDVMQKQEQHREGGVDPELDDGASGADA